MKKKCLIFQKKHLITIENKDSSGSKDHIDWFNPNTGAGLGEREITWSLGKITNGISLTENFGRKK